MLWPSNRISLTQKAVPFCIWLSCAKLGEASGNIVMCLLCTHIINNRVALKILDFQTVVVEVERIVASL